MASSVNKVDMKSVSLFQEIFVSVVEWEIDNITNRTKNLYYASDTFASKSWEGIKWRLLFHHVPAGTAHFYLEVLESDINFLECFIEWLFLDETGKTLQKFTSNPSFLSPYPRRNGWTQFNPNSYLNDDKLFLRVQLTVKSDVTNDMLSQKNKAYTPTKLTSFSLPNDLLHSLIKRDSGDLTLVVGSKELLVHKMIVAARSPVLAAMIKEKKASDKIAIPDVDFDALEKAVYYMYSDIVAVIETVAQQLYPVACKLALMGLKERCEEVLEKNLSVDNAVQTLVICRSETLRKKIIDFMKKDAEAITTSDNFKSMASTHLQLFLDVFSAIKDGETG